ncbi:hypothetical protein G3T14_23650 [Methylobacterium sp. BTF04]|uniref:hypothetical protein n=1 Tax=Methylobacterium sp. BTF04 TaxID=2708300 RepID=UPI0013D0D701|nr:hypothetical protein [Methylobacterium sp. BTF04]NEU15038.1 hypothetical protein [Methylobacterium sp. BTF04]
MCGPEDLLHERLVYAHAGKSRELGQGIALQVEVLVESADTGASNEHVGIG